MKELFKELEMQDGQISVLVGTPKHAAEILYGLIAEAEGGKDPADDSPMIHLAAIEEVVRGVFAVAEASATKWLKPILERPLHSFKPPPGHPETMDSYADMEIRRIGEQEGPLSALNRSMEAVAVYHNSLLDAGRLPETLESSGLGRIFGCMGVYFMELYLREYGMREIHLAQAAQCLFIAGVNSVRDDLERKSVEQKRRAGRARHGRWYAPMEGYAITLFEDGKPWDSTRAAAVDIAPKVFDYGLSKGLAPSKDRNFQTVYEWLLKHASASK